jgi:hypothetical protein
MWRSLIRGRSIHQNVHFDQDRQSHLEGKNIYLIESSFKNCGYCTVSLSNHKTTSYPQNGRPLHLTLHPRQHPLRHRQLLHAPKSPSRHTHRRHRNLPIRTQHHRALLLPLPRPLHLPLPNPQPPRRAPKSGAPYTPHTLPTCTPRPPSPWAM